MSANPANRPPPQPASPPSPGEALRVIAGMTGRTPDDRPGTSPDGGMLTIIPRNCIGCRTCELACSFTHAEHGRFARSRIRVHQMAEKRFVQMTCLQCVDAACVKACPVEALARSTVSGAVEVNERCIGCSLCEKACPFGHMHFDRETRIAVKCDLCKGSPACAMFCPNRALEIR